MLAKFLFMFYRSEPCRCAVLLPVQRSCSVSAGSTVQSHEAVPSCSSWQPNQRVRCWLTSAGEPAHCANIKGRHVYAVFLGSGELHTLVTGTLNPHDTEQGFEEERSGCRGCWFWQQTQSVFQRWEQLLLTSISDCLTFISPSLKSGAPTVLTLLHLLEGGCLLRIMLKNETNRKEMTKDS